MRLTSLEVVLLFTLLVALALVYAASLFIVQEEGPELVIAAPAPGAFTVGM